MSKRVITFGEIMLRLAPEGYYRFVQANNFGQTTRNLSRLTSSISTTAAARLT